MQSPTQATSRRDHLWPWSQGLYQGHERDLTRLLISSLQRGIGEHLLTLNLDIYAQLRTLPADAVADLTRSYTRIVADGKPIVWASRLAGRRLNGRITGADLLPSLTGEAIKNGLRVHISGGPPGAAEAAARSLDQEAFQRGQISHSSFELPDDRKAPAYNDAALAILESSPDIVFTGYGFPKQDHLAENVRRRQSAVTVIGCGGAVSFAGGLTRRAPALIGRVGLEWAFRLTVEPRRLWRRYIVRDFPAIFPLMLAAWRAGKRA